MYPYHIKGILLRDTCPDRGQTESFVVQYSSLIRPRDVRNKETLTKKLEVSNFLRSFGSLQHVMKTSERSNPWPSGCLPRMKCTPYKCETKSLSYCGTFLNPRRNQTRVPGLGFIFRVQEVVEVLFFRSI